MDRIAYIVQMYNGRAFNALAICPVADIYRAYK